MLRVGFINGWEGHTDVAQDVEPVILTTGGGLYTGGLMNCLCLVATDRISRYGMMHVQPGHENVVVWGRSLLTQVGATQAFITGANGGQTAERRNCVRDIFANHQNVELIDETMMNWIPDDTTSNVRLGTQETGAGSAAVRTTDGGYAIGGGAGFPATPAAIVAPPPIVIATVAAAAAPPRQTRPQRKGQGGCCVIL